MTTPGLHPALEPIDDLDWTRLEEFLRAAIPEDERLDYKDRLAASTAETIAAMANGSGGTVIVGVREGDQPNVPGSWDGLTGDLAAAVRNTVWSYCVPGPAMRLSEVTNPTTGNALVVVAVAPAPQPPVWHRDRGVVVRVGDQTRPARPDLLEAWFRARASGNPSEVALRQRTTAAGAYGPPGYLLTLWPIAATPRSRFAPDTDLELDRLAGIALRPDRWTGSPHRSDYVLEATRPDRWLQAAVAEEAFVRHMCFARAPEEAARADFVASAADLVREFARSLIFAELALENVCGASPPFRVELTITYGTSWRLSPPAPDIGFNDPHLPATPAQVEHPTSVESSLSTRGASDTTVDLVVGTLRRLRWRHFDSVVAHLTANLPAAVDRIYARAAQ